MPAIILLFLGKVPIRDWFWLALVVAIVGAGLYARGHYINLGKKEAITDINNANAKSQRSADEGIKDVAKCYDSGLDWDRTRGVCITPAAGQ